MILPNREDHLPMRLIGREKIITKTCIGLQEKRWVMTWIAEVMHAHWKHPSDVFTQFPNAIMSGEKHFIFPILSQQIHIETCIAFPQEVVLIQDFVSGEYINER